MKRTTAAGSSAGAYVDYVAGVNAGTLLVAEDRNNLQEEICHVIEAAGFTLDGADQYQLLRANIALSRPIGDMIMSEIKLTPVIVSASKSTANPSYPNYLPIIDRTDADHDITTAMAPDLVTAYRAYAANVLGSASFTATVAGSVLTFANTTVNNALIKAISEDALVQRWLSSNQSATYDGSGPDFTNGRCINVAGTDYAITAISIGSRTITVSGSPTSGSQTVIFYPYRIAGSTTSVRLHRLSGFVPVASGDSDGVEIEGLRHMDTGQGHEHLLRGVNAGGLNQSLQQAGTDSIGGYTTAAAPTYNQTVPTGGRVMTGYGADASNGTPRIGKNNSPRSHSRRIYTWAGRLIA